MLCCVAERDNFMRMRKKPNLLPRLERVAGVQISDPEAMRGKWRETFPDYEKLWVELGCGKGRFTAGLAAENPRVLLAAVERVPDAMVMAMERCVAAGLANVRFMDRDVAELGELFAPDEVDGIYINFCDPWPKSRDAKHRLTAPDFLRQYAALMPTGGRIYFKTDNLPLFDWSERQMLDEGWSVGEVTRDLHANGECGIMTDYEEKFHRQGVKINRLVAEKTTATKTTADGPHERLRNAGLRDARGYKESMEASE